MGVIIFTVITQGFAVPSEDKGSLRGNLFINGGVIQAIGVISFGKSPYSVLQTIPS
jgi:hypothetical protein